MGPGANRQSRHRYQLFWDRDHEESSRDSDRCRARGVIERPFPPLGVAERPFPPSGVVARPFSLGVRDRSRPREG